MARDSESGDSATPDFGQTQDLGRDFCAGRLMHMGVLRLAGPDAIAFLQGQVSNDTAPLADGRPVLAAYSTPQGRVLAVLHLLPHSTGILALLPREIAEPTRARLRKFVLRAKVAIEDLSGQFDVVGADDSALRAAGITLPGSTGYAEEGGISAARVHRDVVAPERYWLVGAAAARGAGVSSGDFAAVERGWRQADIRDGLPQVYAATSELFVAQMLNLDLIGGISFGKGCYTGQEIIARTQHLGRIKRRMSRLRLPSGSWAIGQPLRLADGRAGRLTELAPVGDGVEALAVLSLEAGGAESESASGEAIAVEELPLPYRSR